MKKILALCLVVVLAVTAVAGATLAYFTDKDAKTNTFTVGDVSIRIDEMALDAEDNLIAYTDNQKLSPIAQSKAPFNKLVFTVNDGTQNAYVRTFITCPKELYYQLGYGFQSGPDAVDPTLLGAYTARACTWKDVGFYKVDGEEVAVFLCEVVDKTALVPGESLLSLTKIWVYENVKNADIGDGFEVKVVSQAIQEDNLTYEDAMKELGAVDQALITKLFG